MAASALEVRNSVIAHLRKNHPDICRHWFDDIQALDFDNGTLRLLVHEPVQLKYLQKSCVDRFNEAAQSVTGRLVAVLFVGEEEAQTIIARKSAPRSVRSNGQAASRSEGGHYDEMLISPDYTFENFVEGPGNRLAHAAAKAVSQKPGEAYNPFFIHGGVGLGKTHLLHAICQAVMNSFPEKRIYYVSCDSFTNQFMESVQAGEMLDFRNRFRCVDVLMIDDIHFLSKRDRTQEEFFHTFNTLYQAGKQIVLSSDAAPNEIPDLEERLVSRFNSGLVAQIEKPCFETRVAIVKMKAAMRGLAIPDDVAAFIGHAVDSNIRELEGAITKLQITATIKDRAIDLDMAREAIDAPGGGDSSQQPTVQNIIDVVCDYYDVKLADILSKRKYKSIAEPRQVCMWLARRLTRYSLEEIGGYFGGRDHTTVLHAIKTIERKRQAEERLGKDVNHLERRLGNAAG